mmetsp:Transcript_13847/g.27590  ORF Transcript_13847/g.27590 Transcript_13847/m.27590 type:complete len:92 (+) Transcript_13847:2488-2763(+)
MFAEKVYQKLSRHWKALSETHLNTKQQSRERKEDVPHKLSHTNTVTQTEGGAKDATAIHTRGGSRKRQEGRVRTPTHASRKSDREEIEGDK